MFSVGQNNSVSGSDAAETAETRLEHPPKGDEGKTCEPSEPVRAVRRRLPDERRALTHHFSVGGQEGYLTVGVYEDGLPGEIFIRMAKEGSTISGLMDSFATVVSLALQHGVPLELLCTKFSHTRFERLVRESKDRLRQLPDGLSIPVDGANVP